MRVEREGGAAAWLAETLEVPSVQGHELPQPQELWPYQNLFLGLLLVIRRPLWPAFSVAPPIQALRGLPFLVFFSVVWCVRHMEGPLWLGSYFMDQHIRHLKGHPRWDPTL